MDVERDISKGEIVEADLDRLIEKRHDRRILEEGEREELEAWRVTELAEEARKREERRLEWCAYFERVAGSLRARAEEYDQRAQTLMETNERKTA